jgi:signal transduction histidine kinase
VEVRAARAGGSVEFRVRDTGPGIAPEQVPHLFDRFWQGSRERRGSAGLGLAIVKGIVEAHGGRILVDSAVGRGTTFRFSVPLQA